jgi:2-methylisocitrate lyase-like PEP mutase family enzyme
MDPAPVKPSIDALLATGEPLVLPGIWDALSGRLAERAGFRVVFLSGYCVSATRLGRPDFGFVTQTEMVETARRLCLALDAPLLVDIDTGYGNAFNVEQTVAELVQAGVAGVFLEDQVWPKRCGHMRGKRVVPLDEYLPKLRAALRARGGAAFHVTARTDARAAVGLDEAIARARAFADAGADAVFVEAPETVDEMAAVRAGVPARVPLVANMVEEGRTPLRSVRELAAVGYQMIAFPLTALLTAATAVGDAYAAIARDGTAATVAGRRHRFDDMNALLGLDELYRRERDWLDRP